MFFYGFDRLMVREWLRDRPLTSLKSTLLFTVCLKLWLKGPNTKPGDRVELVSLDILNFNLNSI